MRRCQTSLSNIARWNEKPQVGGAHQTRCPKVRGNVLYTSGLPTQVVALVWMLLGVGGLHFWIFGISSWESFSFHLMQLEVSTFKLNINYSSDWWFMLVAYTVGASTSTHPSNTQNNQNPSLKLIISSKQLHPGRLTWNLQITHLERNMIFQTSMIVFHVILPGCTHGP